MIRNHQIRAPPTPRTPLGSLTLTRGNEQPSLPGQASSPALVDQPRPRKKAKTAHEAVIGKTDAEAWELDDKTIMGMSRISQ